jgi:ketosteroid isomerase-like protein
METSDMTRLFATIALFACTSAFADARHDVQCREIGFSKSVEVQDAESFRSFIDPDARFVNNSVSKGIDAIAEGWSAFLSPGGPTIKWRPQFIEVLEDGKLALTRGPYRMITTDDDGNKSESWGTFNSVWRLGADGQWQVVFDAGNSAEGAPSDEVQALLDEADDCESPDS